MNSGPLSKILRFLFSIYGILVYLLFSTASLPFYFIIFSCFPAKKSPHTAHVVSRIVFRLFLSFFLIRIDIKGTEFVSSKKTYVFICNHRSLLDIPLAALSCKNTFRFLSKIELTKIPVMGYVIRKLYIAVDRSSKENRSKSFETMKKSIVDGISVFLFPEGTRNKTSNLLLDMREGAFRLAIETQTPIAILTVLNSHELLPPSGLMALRPGTLHAIWSEPIETKGMSADDFQTLKTKAHRLMKDNLENYISGR